MQSNLLTRAAGLVQLARAAKSFKNAAEGTTRDNARLHLIERMGRLRGLPQKIGQILSMKSDDNNDFECLVDHAEALPLEVIVPILEDRWEKPIDEVVEEIATEGLAASLGQVHKTKLVDGRVVAVKVRYPGIVKAVKNDTRMLGGISYLVGDLRRGFDLGDYRREVLRDVAEELDYVREAENQREYGDLELAVPGWRIPRVVDELSGDDLLVTEWEEGVSIREAKDWPHEERRKLATTLLKGFCEMLFGRGLLHADPHPGNYRFRHGEMGPEVILLDFGSVVRIPKAERLALLKLIVVARTATGDPLRLLRAMGFNQELLEPISEKLPGLFRVLLEPFITQGSYDLNEWNRVERIDDVLGNDRWNFRMSGPASLVLLMRAFHGLLYYIEKLDVAVPWAVHLRKYEQDYAAELASIDTSPLGDGRGAMDRLAKKLRLRVSENGKMKVELSFPSVRVDHLEDLIDDELRQRLVAKGVDTAEIVRSARRNCYAPCDLFVLEETETSKEVKVWLE